MLAYRLVVGLFAISLVAFIGCSGGPDEPKTYRVYGEVSFGGKPIDEGTIQFVNMKESFNRGIDIKNGKFEGECIEGEMRIEVRAYKPGKVNAMYADDPNAKPEMENYIPKKYNQDSELKETVKADGENHFLFDLK